MELKPETGGARNGQTYLVLNTVKSHPMFCTRFTFFRYRVFKKLLM